MIDKKNFKITLLFPPVWLPETPYLSLPALSAYLKHAGYNPLQKDLNIELWQQFYQEDRLKEIYRWSRETYSRLQQQDVPCFNDEDDLDFMVEFRMMFLDEDKISGSGRILNFASMPFPSEEEFINRVKEGKTKKRAFRKLCSSFWQSNFREDDPGSIPASQWESSIKYHDYFFTTVSLSHYSSSTKNLLKIVNDERRNPYIQYFKKNVIKPIAAQEPHLVGISIIAINQVIPAFTLAKLLKESLKNVHIVMGGPWCTHLFDILPQKFQLFKWVDSFVVYEGEKALLELAESLRLRKSLSSVPNMIYKDGNHILSNDIIYDQGLNILPSPDFQGLPLEDYELVNMLPLQASRGCPWHRCVFCSYPVIEPVFRIRKAELVIEDMKNLMGKYEADEFCFTDSVIEPIHFNEISRLILKDKLDTRWLGFARFDGKITPEIINRMASAGCHELFWGLESGCKRILKQIRKGHSPSLGKRILKYSADAGIHNKVGVMYGFPTETIEEVKTTIRFIEKNIENIHSLAYNFLTLERNTPIVKNPNAFSLNFEKSIDHDLDLGYNYKTMISNDDLKQLENQLWELGVRVERFHE